MTVLFCGSEPEDFTPWPDTAGSTDATRWRTGTVRYALTGTRSFSVAPHLFAVPTSGATLFYVSASFKLPAGTPSGWAKEPIFSFDQGGVPRIVIHFEDDTLPARWAWSRVNADSSWTMPTQPWVFNNTLAADTLYRVFMVLRWDKADADIGTNTSVMQVEFVGVAAAVISPASSVLASPGTGIDGATLYNMKGASWAEVIAANETTKPMYLIALPPNGTGTLDLTQGVASTGWTGGYGDVDENPHSSADTISTGTAGDGISTRLTDLPDAPTIAGTPPGGTFPNRYNWKIHGVKVNAVAQSEGAGPTNLSVGVRTGGQQRFATAAAVSSGAYQPVTNLWTTNPVTGAAWTEAEVNAAQAVLKAT